MDVHFDPVVLAALFVRGFEGAAIGGAAESEKLVKTVAETGQSADGAIDSSISPAGFAAVGILFTHDLLGDFDETVKNVADGTSQLARGGVMRARR